MNTIASVSETNSKTEQDLIKEISYLDHDAQFEYGFILSKVFPAHCINFISKKICERCGYASEEDMIHDINCGTFNRIHPDDADRVMKKIKECRTQKYDYDLVFRCKNKDNHYSWVAEHSNVIIDVCGAV